MDAGAGRAGEGGPPSEMGRPASSRPSDAATVEADTPAAARAAAAAAAAQQPQQQQQPPSLSCPRERPELRLNDQGQRCRLIRRPVAMPFHLFCTPNRLQTPAQACTLPVSNPSFGLTLFHLLSHLPPTHPILPQQRTIVSAPKLRQHRCRSRHQPPPPSPALQGPF